MFLKSKSISPYTGDTYHETPITLVLAEYLDGLPDVFQFLVFILCDILTAVILALAVEEARKFYVRKTVCSYLKLSFTIDKGDFRFIVLFRLGLKLMRSQKESKYVADAKQLEIGEENYAPYVIMSYLLNPFCVMNCVGQTTTVFGNLISSMAIYTMLKGEVLI